MPVTFRPLRVEDLAAIQLQPSQAMLGCGEISAAMAPALVASDAWAAEQDGRLLCCAGLHRLAAGWHATAWAMLASSLGPAHVAVTRFARARIAEHPARRVEATVRIDGGKEQRWAEMVGLELESAMLGWGPQEYGALLYARLR